MISIAHYLLAGMAISAVLSVLDEALAADLAEPPSFSWLLRFLIVVAWPALLPVFVRRVPRILGLLWKRFMLKRRLK